MTSELDSYVRGTAGLSVLVFLSVLLTFSRPRVAEAVAKSRRFSTVAAVAIGAQLAHFVEELNTRFYELFPAQLGLAPWSVRFFVVFNLVCLAFWVLAAIAVRARIVAALVPLWFLALALVLNLVAHSLLALRAGGYFPGLLTAPLVGLAGFMLLRELSDLTAVQGRPA